MSRFISYIYKMIEVITGIIMSVITQIVKKTEIDAKIIIMALAFIFGAAFYFLKLYYPEFVENARKQVLGAYWISQIIYNYIIQIWEEKKSIKKTK